MIRFILVLCLMATPALAQVESNSAKRKCWLKNELLGALTNRYQEIPRFSGIEVDTNEAFTWYLNLEKQTSSYVTFPVPNIACMIPGKKVIFARREGDL